MTTGHFPRAGWGWGSSGATRNPWDTLVDAATSHAEHLPAASRSPAVDAQPQNPPPKASPSTCLELQNTSWHPKGRRPHCRHGHPLLFVLSNLGGARARHVQCGRRNEHHPSVHIAGIPSEPGPGCRPSLRIFLHKPQQKRPPNHRTPTIQPSLAGVAGISREPPIGPRRPRSSDNPINSGALQELHHGL